MTTLDSTLHHTPMAHRLLQHDHATQRALMPQTVSYYDVRTLCQAWCSDALRHGSQKGVCLKLGLSPSVFSAIQHGRATLPPHILDALGLLPVRDVHTPAILGYISEGPVDFSQQWVLPDAGADQR